MLARIVRFQRALAARGPWAEVAQGCGYYDQAHLIRDFREFSGLSPAAYRAADHPMSDAFISR
jgi:AraC-like DNA-binding protein